MPRTQVRPIPFTRSLSTPHRFSPSPFPVAYTRAATDDFHSALIKAAHLYFWPSPKPEIVGFFFTGLTVYHAGRTMAYHWFLYLISRSQRHTEQLKHKVRELLQQRLSGGTCREGGVEDLSEDDLRAWCGWKFKVLTYVAWDRNMRASFYQGGLAMSLLELFGGWLTF